MGATEPDLDRAAGGATAVAAPPWWALTSAMITPIALLGGWWFAEERQGDGCDAIDPSVGFLSGHGAQDRYLMTAALVSGGQLPHHHRMRHARGTPHGPLATGIGGMTGVLVALLPEPDGGTTLEHVRAASAGAALLTIEAAFTGDRQFQWPSPLSVRGASMEAVWPIVITLALHWLDPAP